MLFGKNEDLHVRAAVAAIRTTVLSAQLQLDALAELLNERTPDEMVDVIHLLTEVTSVLDLAEKAMYTSS